MCLNTTESEQRKNSSAGRPVSFSEKVLNFLATKVWLRTGSWKISVCLRSPLWIPLCLGKPSPTKTVVFCCYGMMLSHVKLSITVVSLWSIEFLLLCLASLAQLHVVLYSFHFFAFWYLLFVESSFSSFIFIKFCVCYSLVYQQWIYSAWHRDQRCRRSLAGNVAGWRSLSIGELKPERSTAHSWKPYKRQL